MRRGSAKREGNESVNGNHDKDTNSWRQIGRQIVLFSWLILFVAHWFLQSSFQEMLTVMIDHVQDV